MWRDAVCELVLVHGLHRIHPGKLPVVVTHCLRGRTQILCLWSSSFLAFIRLTERACTVVVLQPFDKLHPCPKNCAGSLANNLTTIFISRLITGNVRLV
jgi:hypothetical protein